MQTFLPYPSFQRSVRCLDSKRLGKQRVEARQILETLLGIKQGWRSHPAVKMWAGHEGALYDYLLAARTEWASRGYANTKTDAFLSSLHGVRLCHKVPAWLGSRKFHAAHRSNLLRKDKQWYSQFGWKETADLPYIWPA